MAQGGKREASTVGVGGEGREGEAGREELKAKKKDIFFRILGPKRRFFGPAF